MIRNRSIPILCFSLLAAFAGNAMSSPFGPAAPFSPSLRQFSAYSTRVGIDFNQAGTGIGVWNDRNPVTIASDRIFGQRLQSDGTPLGGTFVVNASDGDLVEDASVGIDAQGNSIAVWTRTLATGRGSVRARRFNAAGQPLTGEIVVHSHVNSAHYDPAIAVWPDGRFVVVWSSGVQDGFGDVFMRQFNTDGTPQGPEVMVNTNTAYDQVNPAISLAADGSLAIVWEAKGIRVGTDIAYRVFDSAGHAVSDDVLVNSELYYGDQRNPTIARNASGLTAIAWDCYGCDANDWGIRARLFNAIGAPVTPEFVVNQHISDNQVTAAAAVDADGKVLLVWSSEHAAESRTTIDGRYFDAAGTPLTDEFMVLQEPPLPASTPMQVNPVARVDAQGLHRVAWAAYGAQASQTAMYSARAYSVDAGADQIVSAHGPMVELSGSTNAGAPVTAWHWSQSSGPPVALQNTDQPIASFVTPFETTTLTFRLSVHYADGTASVDRTTVHIDVDAPQADAGLDQVTAEGEWGQLVGSGTAHNGGSIASFHWLQTSGPAIVLTDPNAAQTGFSAPQVSANSVVTLRLVVTDDSGQTATDDVSVQVLNVNQAPVADFSFSANDLTASFVDASVDPDGTITSRSWNFGDSTASTVANPAHTYTAPGTYVVTLTVTDNDGEARQISRNVTVTAPPPNVAPVANFTFTTNNATASFFDASSDADGTIASRRWEFGDGSSSTATNPTRTFAVAGTYAVTLTVTDNRGASAQTVRSVTVTANPPPDSQLQKGVPKGNISGAKSSERYYTMVVPSGAYGLSFQMSGGTGDADLYVRFGSAPTTSAYECRPYLSGNNETCTISTVRAGTYHVMIRGYSSYTGVQLIGRYSTPTP
ncbi:PPC domain-containing protein [Ahniella affigens]|uniref:PPC domain-containing protein n=1 Tax=Ahniella affigens TaxID=2021234 RepID=UPI0011B1F5A3|nr:PPC domain-containing protein [Ahniella affigens]